MSNKDHHDQCPYLEPGVDVQAARRCTKPWGHTGEHHIKPQPTPGDIYEFRVNAEGLTREVLNNAGCAVLKTPMNIFRDLLHRVGVRAAEINDDELNGLMCMLGIYAISNGFDPGMTLVCAKRSFSEATRPVLIVSTPRSTKPSRSSITEARLRGKGSTARRWRRPRASIENQSSNASAAASTISNCPVHGRSDET